MYVFVFHAVQPVTHLIINSSGSDTFVFAIRFCTKLKIIIIAPVYGRKSRAIDRSPVNP